MDALLAGIVPHEPGIVVLVVKNGTTTYEKAVGSANLELNVPLQPGMVFRIGSITKQFTAIGILQLEEQGKLSLQDSIQQYIKDFPSKGAVITLENLLTHTSGLPDYTSIDSHDPYIERRDFEPVFIINYFKHAPLEFKPGTHYGYSNSNYALLAYIIEKVSGMPYHQYIAQNVISRAGLIHTCFAMEKTIVPLRVTGYTRNNGFFEHCDYQTLSIGYGCGDLLSTAPDLLTWNNALLAGKLVSAKTLQRAFTPYHFADGTLSTYGYGWFIDQRAGATCIHHEGQTSGFIASEQFFPDSGIYIVILTNVKSGEDKTDFSDRRFQLFANITRQVMEHQKKRIELTSRQLQEYTGTYQAGKQTIAITAKKGMLVCEASIEGRFMLDAAGADQFTISGISDECRFTFVRDVAGKVIAFISLQPATFSWQRTTPVTDTISGPLAAYTGKYQLTSMRNAFNIITIRNHQLLLSSTTPMPDDILLPLGGDRFKYNGADYQFEIAFTRDEKGEIQQLRTIQGPVYCRKISP